MPSVESILVIRLARLGDIVLALPALARLKSAFPRAHLTFLTDQRFAPLAALCPVIDEVLPVNRLAWRDGPLLAALRDIRRLLRQVRARRFDLLIDLHSFHETNLFAWLSRSPQRLALKRFDRGYLAFCFNLPPVVENKGVHVSEMFLRVVESLPAVAAAPAPPVRPLLVVPEEARQWAAGIAGGKPLLALFVGAYFPSHLWPPERFAAIAHFAIERLGAAVVVLAGSTEAGLAEQVRAAARQGDRLQVVTEMTLPHLAALIASARLLVSNDTGPMHIGPAVGVPTLGLFGGGFPELYRPLGSRSRYLEAESMEAIAVAEVLRAVEQMWAPAVSSPR